MQREELEQSLLRQRKYFRSGATLDVSARIRALDSLRSTMEKYESDIYSALRKDLGKSEAESYMCEVGLVYSEITWMKKHVRKFAKEKTVRTPLAQFHARSFKKPSPKGVVLIMSPWNYPIMLTLEPLVDALAAGCCAVLKPSAYAPACSDIMVKIVEEAFPSELVSIVTGGRAENTQLLEMEWDHIFFTGSQAVGRTVLHAAADHLTPVSLELGGKSPCIVDETANLKLAARRIAFGKWLNCGQTCVAPDYLLVHSSVKDQLIAEIKKEITKQYGAEPLDDPDYGKIITEKHYKRLSDLMDRSPVLFGGKRRDSELRIEPTIIGPCNWDSLIMEDEIFGPFLPVIEFTDIDETLEKINDRQHPLAFYLFSSDRKTIRKVKDRCLFGGGCINDTIIHLATSEMGFGGVGPSGMGSYHGKIGFDTFSHTKSIVDKKTWMDLPMRYQPYTDLYRKVVRMFLH